MTKQFSFRRSCTPLLQSPMGLAKRDLGRELTVLPEVRTNILFFFTMGNDFGLSKGDLTEEAILLVR